LTAGDLLYILFLTSSLLVLDTVRKVVVARHSRSSTVGSGSSPHHVEGQVMGALNKLGAKLKGGRGRRKSYSPVPKGDEVELSVV